MFCIKWRHLSSMNISYQKSLYPRKNNWSTRSRSFNDRKMKNNVKKKRLRVKNVSSTEWNFWTIILNPTIQWIKRFNVFAVIINRDGKIAWTWYSKIICTWFDQTIANDNDKIKQKYSFER